MIGEISSIIGLKVYTDEGRYVGRVDDLVIDMEKRMITGIAMAEYNKLIIESKSLGVILPYRIVKSVGDIVIVKDVFKKKNKETKEEEES
ncbi:MAG: photosystem reaction center subunit H [Archaeoglobus sp.]|jgi:sporulation protein YlmC with PRC-barrel domain|nr:MAG: photosystem reaction center subunit H [Archaeoglobus sp.]